MLAQTSDCDDRSSYDWFGGWRQILACPTDDTVAIRQSLPDIYGEAVRFALSKDKTNALRVLLAQGATLGAFRTNKEFCFVHHLKSRFGVRETELADGGKNNRTRSPDAASNTQDHGSSACVGITVTRAAGKPCTQLLPSALRSPCQSLFLASRL